MAEYRIVPSRRLRQAQIALHAVAGLAVWLAALPWPAQVGASLGVLLSAAWALRQGAPVRLRCRDDGSLMLATGQEWRRYRLAAGSLILPALCVLALRAEDGQRLWLPILADSLPAQDFRRLRVWLRWKAARHMPRAARAETPPPGSPPHRAPTSRR